MQAQLIHEHGGLENLRFEENWPKPELQAGHVIVKVGACSLNYHDLFTLKGMPGIKIPLPIIPGIDVAGTVAETEEGSAWKVGDRVLVDPIGREKFSLIGETTDGGLAEYCRVPENQLIRLPDDISLEDAAALPVAYGTAYRMMVTRYGMPLDGSMAGKKIFILGASGGVGTCCVQLAVLSGAEVIVAASTEDKLQKLYNLGAHHGINYKDQDFKDALHEMVGKPRISGKGGVDVVVNFTGGDTWLPSIKVLKKGGSILTCGATAGYAVKSDMRYIWTFELNILGSNAWLREDLHELIDLVRKGKLSPPIETRLPLADAGKAFKSLEERSVFGKIIVHP